MGLIDSPRMTGADRAHWQRLEHYDDILSRSSDLAARCARAMRDIEEFAAGGDCFVSCSWGKDSVVVADLAARTGLDIPVAFARARHWETPEVDQVRDAFLARHPHVRYIEREYVFRVPMRGEPGWDNSTVSQDALAETLGGLGRRICGVRAEESRIRALSAAWHGVSTARICRPVIRWRAAEHIFPYLHDRDLPIHPLYGMSCGGYYDRRWLRVHALGCEPPALSAAHGRDPESWELLYYQDVLDAAAAARAGMWGAAC